MTEWNEIEASWGAFVGAARLLVEKEPDITMGRVHRFYAGAMGEVDLHCGESVTSVEWLEELHDRDQLTARFQRAIDYLRQHEARRVAEHEILMGTMARFYVSEL